jgi:formiminotetrahydrofolate cyclodeaminase
MAYSGVLGGIYNVLINLKDIDDKEFCDEMRLKCDRLKKSSGEKLEKVLSFVESKLQ